MGVLRGYVVPATTEGLRVDRRMDWRVDQRVLWKERSLDWGVLYPPIAAARAAIEVGGLLQLIHAEDGWVCYEMVCA